MTLTQPLKKRRISCLVKLWVKLHRTLNLLVYCFPLQTILRDLPWCSLCFWWTYTSRQSSLKASCTTKHTKSLHGSSLTFWTSFNSRFSFTTLTHRWLTWLLSFTSTRGWRSCASSSRSFKTKSAKASPWTHKVEPPSRRLTFPTTTCPMSETQNCEKKNFRNSKTFE